ncbi:hypothetical protein B0J12DRAFT_26996 [Macrophomina phaseolina]|uniref:Uncharacterized protein n=1 Tax=Macrophomina phaseolina TaxID=35725 RepID=A0ABQ8GYE5_9PEZI|nr:hypothetical protein B0J12DRAFT_26996 [Macrophomina phaseolina]
MLWYILQSKQIHDNHSLDSIFAARPRQPGRRPPLLLPCHLHATLGTQLPELIKKKKTKGKGVHVTCPSTDIQYAHASINSKHGRNTHTHRRGQKGGAGSQMNGQGTRKDLGQETGKTIPHGSRFRNVGKERARMNKGKATSHQKPLYAPHRFSVEKGRGEHARCVYFCHTYVRGAGGRGIPALRHECTSTIRGSRPERNPQRTSA